MMKAPLFMPGIERIRNLHNFFFFNFSSLVYVIFPQAGPKSGLNLTSSVISLTREAVFYNIDAGKTIVEKVILKPYPSMKKNIFSYLVKGSTTRMVFF